MVDLVSISLAQSLGITPCDKKKHQHEEPIMEGIGRKKVKTYGFYHLKLCMTDRWNCSVQCIRPFLAVDRGSCDSQVLLGRPVLGGRLVVSGVIYWSRCVEGSVVVCRVYISC